MKDTGGPALKWEDLSRFQQRLLAFLSNHSSVQIAGHGMASWLSVAGALQRRGLADSHRTGHYYLTKAGKVMIAEKRRREDE